MNFVWLIFTFQNYKKTLIIIIYILYIYTEVLCLSRRKNKMDVTSSIYSLLKSRFLICSLWTLKLEHFPAISFQNNVEKTVNVYLCFILVYLASCRLLESYVLNLLKINTILLENVNNTDHSIWALRFKTFSYFDSWVPSYIPMQTDSLLISFNISGIHSRYSK